MKTKEDIDKLVEENIKLVGYALNKYFKKFREIYPYLEEDLYQEGCIGLFQAAKKYNTDKGAFSTIAMKYIRGRMTTFFKRYVKKHYSYKFKSMESTILDSNDSDSIRLMDILPSNDNITDFRLYSLEKRVKHSDINDIDIIVKMIADGYSQREIGKQIGISQVEVSRRLTKFKDKIESVDKLMEILYRYKVSQVKLWSYQE